MGSRELLASELSLGKRWDRRGACCFCTVEVDEAAWEATDEARLDVAVWAVEVVSVSV